MAAKERHLTSKHMYYYYNNNLLVSCSFLYFSSNLLHQLYVYFAMYVLLFAFFLLVITGNDDYIAYNKIHFNICYQFSVLFNVSYVIYSDPTEYTK